MELFKTVSGKVAGGVVILAVIIAGISWWQMAPESRQMIVNGTGKIAGWLGVVIFLPWATFFVIGRVARIESNLAGAMLVLMYTAAEAALLAWLFGWNIRGAGGWTFLLVGTLVAAVYNLFVCDWIAEKME